MSRSQPEMPCSSNRSSGGNEPERNLMDLISNWKTKSRMDSQYDRIKKMLFSFNQKPTDFKPTDFFPPIPDSEIASDSEEKTIDRKTTEADKERKSLSKRKLDYENLAEIESRSDTQNQSASQSPSDLNVSKCLNENENQNENEKQRRQPISNEFNDLERLSPINSPTHTNRNLIKLNRASLLKQLQNDESTQNIGQVSRKKSTNETNKIDKIIDILSLSKKSINQSRNSLSSVKSPVKSLKTQDELINKTKEHVQDKEPQQPKNKSAEKIELDRDKENNNQNSANEEMSIFNPPTPPSVQQQNNRVETLCTQQGTGSSITITKRRSAEPVRDIYVDLSNLSAKSKILSKQKSIEKPNESINDDQTELLNSQSNTFIRRRSTLSNKTTNSTVNSSTSASILFKPLSRQKKTTSHDLKEFPPPPLFPSDNPKTSSSEHETSNEKSSRKAKQKKTRHKKSTKKTLKKQQVETKEPEESKSETDARDDIQQQHDKALNTQEAHNDNLIEIEKNADENVDVDFQAQLNQKSTDTSKITSFLKKKSIAEVATNEKTISKQTDQSLSPIITKTTKQKSEQKNQILIQKTKNTKTRQPLNNIKNKEPISKAKTKKNSQNEFGYFNNNKTVPYEPKMVDECENDPSLALRRSKRAKIDKNSQPIYGYEEISDYQGNKCIVRKVVGTKDKIGLKINMELIRINHLSETHKTRESKKKKRQENKNVHKKQNSTALKNQEEMDNNKRIDDHLIDDPVEQLNRIEPDSEPQFDQVNEQHQQDAVVDQDCLEADNLHKNNETLSISLNSNVNNSMEFIYSKTDNCTQPVHLYYFHKNIEKKIFQPYSKGVQISPISDLTGIFRITGTSSTKTDLHDFAVNFYVQNGSFLFSLNGKLSMHHEKDVIYIPKNTPYKIKNVSDNEEHFAYIYFHFEK